MCIQNSWIVEGAKSKGFDIGLGCYFGSGPDGVERTSTYIFR
jgi:hypothetical protein